MQMMIDRMIHLSNNPEDQIYKKTEPANSNISFVKAENSATEFAAPQQPPGVRMYILNDQ
jgi:hypothetical protein